MSVSSPLYTLLKSNFRAWVSAKGFWLVAAAALLPLVLTGAWVGAHRDDITVSEFRLEGAPYEEGELARFVATIENAGSRAVGGFNVTLAVGEVEAGRLFPAADNTTLIERLEPGDKRELVLEWNATPGVVYALVSIDPEDTVGERDEFNNQKAEPLAVTRALPTTPPAAPLGLAGDENATTEVDLVVESITRTSGDLTPGDNATFTVTVRNTGAAVDNASVHVRAVRTVGLRPVAVTAKNETMSFAAGETKTLDVTWTTQEGAFWAEGYILPPSGSKDVTPESNHRAEPFVVNSVVTDDMRPPEPEERLTIKQFYLQVLTGLHLSLLIPLIALFYATGVIADEKDRGSLAYLITRPIPRWLIPITKFAASFLVAAVATTIGVLITYAFLFGTTVEGGDIGFLTTPLLATLLALFAYGALFTFLGTWIDRPYLVGLGYVLAGLVLPLWSVPFVRNFGLPFHLNNALAEWKLDEGLQWLPATPEATRAVWVMLAIGVGSLVAAGVQMRRREFDVG